MSSNPVFLVVKVLYNFNNLLMFKLQQSSYKRISILFLMSVVFLVHYIEIPIKVLSISIWSKQPQPVVQTNQIALFKQNVLYSYKYVT